jgi:hypothetical protein
MWWAIEGITGVLGVLGVYSGEKCIIYGWLFTSKIDEQFSPTHLILPIRSRAVKAFIRQSPSPNSLVSDWSHVWCWVPALNFL